MEFVFDRKKDDVIRILKNDINSNNRYVGDGWKIAGTIDENKVYLNLEDRMGKSSKFMNEVFYGKLSEADNKTLLKGTFRMDTYAMILLAVLFFIALESFIASVVLHGLNSGVIFPLIILTVVILYFFAIKKRSKETNGCIEKYLNSIE